MRNITFEFGQDDVVYFLRNNNIIQGKVEGAKVTGKHVVYDVRMGLSLTCVHADYLFGEIDQLLNNLKYRYENPSKTD